MESSNNMTEELKSKGIIDNPFDLMLHFSLGMVRNILFACPRYGNPEMEGMYANEQNLKEGVEKVVEQLNKLSGLSLETVVFLKETAFYSDDVRFSALNSLLLELEKAMPTRQAHSIPARSLEYEKVRLGEDSDEYKHILYLRSLISNSELKTFSKDTLVLLQDVIEDPQYCTEWESRDKVAEYSRLINKYNLTIDDLEYMISYRDRVVGWENCSSSCNA